ncbi:hypothetical protein [Crocosphaera watsonii]|uniref:Peroxidase n=1 Tax=Crocosphaera watsonii WH 0401 TaxID=555881 RepID=T2J2K7_CROWT|nr:hypothetical protein [Crocosphaera watsonii]CCQ60098.1 hypothetical protein CWATWH0401_2720 [Crocosphaera watsonii WH 0401]
MALFNPNIAQARTVNNTQTFSDTYSRMFPCISALSADEKALVHLGTAMIQSKAQSLDKTLDNKTIPAGYTYLGQFINHDLEFDITSVGSKLVEPEQQKNFRTPLLDLDSVYGQGPKIQPYLYQPEDPDLLMIGLTRVC